MQAAAITMAGVHDPVVQVLPKVLAWVRRAAEQGVGAAFFPELVLGHYFETPVAQDGPEVEAVSRCAQETGTAVGVGIGERRGDDLYSAYVLCGTDGSVSVHRKTRWQTSRCPISLGSAATAHDFLGLKVGIMICAESRFSDVAQSLKAAGAQILIMPHAYGFSGPNCPPPLSAAIADTVAARCREALLPAIVVAAVGDGLQGGFALVSAEGHVLCQQFEDQERLHLFEMSGADKIMLKGIAEPARPADAEELRG